MRKFRLVTLVLCVALLAGVASAAFVPQNKLDSTTLRGTVTAIRDNTFTLKNTSGQGYEEIILSVLPTAPILDAVSGAAVKLADVKIGSAVYGEIGPAVTASLPPQGTCLGLVVNIPADFKVPQYGIIGQVTQQDGKTELLTADGQLQGRIDKDTQILRYTQPGKPAVLSQPTPKDLKPGSTVYLWYGASTRSVPAQTHLDKILLVPAQYDGDVAIGEGKISVDGKALSLTEKNLPAQLEAGAVLVPLRAVAEAAGWKLGWTANDAPITLTKGERTLSVTIGSPDVTEGKEVTPQLLPTCLRGGVTYVDSRLLERNLNLFTMILA